MQIGRGQKVSGARGIFPFAVRSESSAERDQLVPAFRRAPLCGAVCRGLLRFNVQITTIAKRNLM